MLEVGSFEQVRRRADFKRIWGKNMITLSCGRHFQANTMLSEEQGMVGGEPWRWAAESYTATRKPAVVFCVTLDSVCRYSETVEILKRRAPKRTQIVSQAYLAEFAPLAEQRLGLAGFRLAHLANVALDPAYPGPLQDSTQKP